MTPTELSAIALGQLAAASPAELVAAEALYLEHARALGVQDPAPFEVCAPITRNAWLQTARAARARTTTPGPTGRVYLDE